MFNKNLDETLLEITALVDEHMEKLLPKTEEFSESRLAAAMHYSALSSGKRIRPFLTIAAASIFGVSPRDALNCACAIEFIHVYSLIHDDLPAMDDDDFRRGKPSCHKQFDEATAILAGDSLLTFAFEILSNPATHKDANVRCELISAIAKSIGFNGMAGGQMIDLESAGKNLNATEIARLHRLKTGELFMASIACGAILGRTNLELKTALINYAHDIGLAFQIKDDILDHTEKNGEKAKDPSSIVEIIGIENAKEQLNLLHNQAVNHLNIFEEKANLLRELAYFIVTRER